jgi:sodium/pantothenate symporter
LGFGALVFLLALNPPDLLVWINLLAFAGLESTFFCPIIFGLFWRKANSTGAILSMIFGFIVFILLTVTKSSIMGMHNIVPVLAVNIFVFIIGSFFGKKTDENTLKIFFEL